MVLNKENLIKQNLFNKLIEIRNTATEFSPLYYKKVRIDDDSLFNLADYLVNEIKKELIIDEGSSKVYGE